MKTIVRALCSMAPRQMLAALVSLYREQAGVEVALEAAGGVHAAQRVQAGEAFDAVVLAAEAIERLIASGHALAGSRTDIARSPVAIAIRRGAPVPEVGSEAALRRAVLAARTVGCSTGPSGAALAALFARWGIAEEIGARVVTPPPGVAVATLIARGEVALGFQQAAEMLDVPGVEVIGPMPPGVEIETVFSGAVVAASAQADSVRALLAFLASPATAEVKRRYAMAPA